MEKDKLKSVVESLLFSKGSPVGMAQLVSATDAKKEDLKLAIDSLTEDYKQEGRGMEIIKIGSNFQLVSKPENVSFVDKIVKRDLQDSLSRAALEVVSIIAYRGPISRIEIESIRGVNSSFTLRNLLMRGLITRAINKKDQRGYLYKISFEFLKNLGLSGVKELPNYEKLSKDERIESIINIKSEKQ